MNCSICNNKIDNIFKCPIRLTPTCVKMPMLSLCGTTYNFTQPIAKCEIEPYMTIIPPEIEFFEDEQFCSWYCCEKFIEKNFEDYRFSQSLPIISYIKSL